MFDPKNPLIARVFVNRMWQMQFGTGIVETSEDFGMQGSRPTNPALLDWLAVDFIESGWDIKRLNKMIVMSATYRQASDVSEELLKKDPKNECARARAEAADVCRTGPRQRARGQRAAGEEQSADRARILTSLTASGCRA